MPRIIKLQDSNGNVIIKDGQEQTATLTDATLTLMDEHLKQNGVKMSDSDGLFFQRQLEAIETTTYDVLYPDLEARECFTTNTFGGAGVTTLTYRSYDRIGKAQVINARATDLPKSDISGKEYSISVKSLGTAYDFDIDEVAAAQVTGMPLEARRAMASRRGYEELVNDSIWYGNEDFVGFFGTPVAGGAPTQNPLIPRKAITGAVWDDGAGTIKDPDLILADLFGAVQAMHVSTKKIFSPKELWLPVDRYHHIMNTPRNNVSDTTILQFFLKNNAFITDMSQVKALNAIHSEETGLDNECFVLIDPKTPEGAETIRIRETLPLQFLPVQLKGLVYEVPGRGRFAGLEITYPAAIALWYGI